MQLAQLLPAAELATCPHPALLAAVLSVPKNNAVLCAAPGRLTRHFFNESGISPRPSASRSALRAALRSASVSCIVNPCTHSAPSALSSCFHPIPT